MLTWPNEDDQMSLTKICEHDRILDNDERECVELDQKNKKIYHNDKRFRIYSVGESYNIQPYMFVVVVLNDFFFGHIQSFSVMFNKWTFVVVIFGLVPHM